MEVLQQWLSGIVNNSDGSIMDKLCLDAFAMKDETKPLHMAERSVIVLYYNYYTSIQLLADYIYNMQLFGTTWKDS